MSENHCKDCCCAQSWAALGITSYTGRSIPEEIAALAARLAELQAAAWDVHDLVYSALDTPEDADLKAIRKALDAMGELIPAQRPADSANEVQP